MSEHQFAQKTVTIVAGITSTVSWTGPDIVQRFPESIIKASLVAIRFSCSTTAGNAVNCGVRYSTLSKDYRVSERETLFQIPANGGVEVTPATKPALGQMDGNITSISVDLKSLASGNVTIVLIVDDEPPPLSSDPGALIGLDAKTAVDYLTIISTLEVSVFPGVSGYLIYFVPAGQRFILDNAVINLQPTPSYPSLARISLVATISGTPYPILVVDSQTEEAATLNFTGGFTTFQAGDSVGFQVTNNSTSNVDAVIGYIGRQLF